MFGNCGIPQNWCIHTVSNMRLASVQALFNLAELKERYVEMKNWIKCKYGSMSNGSPVILVVQLLRIP
jgi:hypothetical protein